MESCLRLGCHKLAVAAALDSNSLRSHGLQPARLLCPWNSPGKNTAVGCHVLLQGIYLTQGLNLDFFTTEPPGKPKLVQASWQHKFMSHISGGRKSDQGPSTIWLGGRPSCGLQVAVFSLRSLMADYSAIQHALCLLISNPIVGLHPHDLIAPQSPSSEYLHIRMRISTDEFQRHTSTQFTGN